MLSLLAAFGAAMVPATSQVSQDASTLLVSVSETTGQSELRLLDGSLVASTSNEVRNPRVLRPGSDGASVALWEEFDGAQSRQYYSLRLDPLGSFSRVREASSTLHLKNAGSIDPLRSALPEPSAQLAASGNLHIVQFVTQPIEAYTAELEARGAVVRHYLPDSAHLVEMNADVAAAVGGLPFVRWIGPYGASLRVEDALASAIADENTDVRRVHVQVTERGADQKNRVAERVKQLGGNVVWKIDEGFRFDAELTPLQIAAVASFDEVLWIDRWTPFEDDMDKVRADGGANAIEAMAGFNGTGVRAEVMDGNIDTAHPDLQSNPIILHGGNSGSATHGTPCTGIVFGDGAGNAARRGLLPAAQPIFADYGQLSNRYQHTAQLVAPPYNAVFQSNSWGSGRTTVYTSVSMEMDDILFDTDIVILQSQSNAGNRDSRPQAWAKNIIGVGGIRHQNSTSLADDEWDNAGSIGPAADGRLKPDLSYWYDAIFTAQAGGGSTQFGGTSAATPMTAGFFGLFFEMWHAGIFGNTPGATVFDSRPKATLARAFMINAASRYAFSGTNADLTRVHQGWGRADVEKIYEDRDDIFWVNETEVLAETESVAYPLAVDMGTPELAITMIYLDLPGTTSSTVHRINDLSLRVTAPDGMTSYWGNNGLNAGNLSTPGGSSNSRDTVENVFVANPMAGTWIVEVIADEINADSHVETPALDADFALVVRGTSGLDGTPCLAPVPYCPASPNSFSVLGAELAGTGSTSVSDNSLLLTGTGMPIFTTALVARGTDQASVSLGDGTLCIGGSIFRMGVVQTNFIGTATYNVDTTSSPAGGAIVAGSTWNYQLWFRDGAGPGGTGFNLSNGLEVTWCE